MVGVGPQRRAGHVHPKILADGLILKSQATLWRSRTAACDEDEKRALDTLLDRVMRAV